MLNLIDNYNLYLDGDMVKIMISLVLLIAVPAIVFCIYVAVVLLLAASRENTLPEYEDVVIRDLKAPDKELSPT